MASKGSYKAKVKSTCCTPHLSAGVAAPCCVVTLSLVLSDSVMAAPQSSMRRWMTVLTTCIWIGFKVSYAPLRVLGLLALRVLLFYIYTLLPFTWSLPTTVSLLFSVVSHLFLYYSSVSLISNSQGCRFAKLQNSCLVTLVVKARGPSYGLRPMLAGVTLEVTVAEQESKRWLSSAM